MKVYHSSITFHILSQLHSKTHLTVPQTSRDCQVRIKIATDLRKMEHLSFNDEIIKSVSFEILQAEDIRKQSVVEVKYSGKRTVQNGIFVNVENSLRDERLGPLNKKSKCKTL